MCGIALIISGIQIDLCSLFPSYSCISPQLPHQDRLLTEDDIRVALERRGPDSLGTKSIYLDSKVSSHEPNSRSAETLIQTEGAGGSSSGSGELRFIGSTLQLRGIDPVVQPLIDACGDVLVYNGEIFGGIYVGSESNDTEILMQSLGRCCSCFSHEDSTSSYCFGGIQNSVPELLSRIKGPWALIYWQDSSKTLWFGRDAFGRRSLAVHWPSIHDSRLLLSSVSPSNSLYHIDMKDGEGRDELNFWEELPCGIYSISLFPLEMDGYLKGKIEKHEWPDSELQRLITWERTSILPKPEQLTISQKVPIMQQETLTAFSSELGHLQNMVSETPHKVLMALKKSVMRRTVWDRNKKTLPINVRQERFAPIAVLFSGGLDSMIIAALLHQCIDSGYEIDLLNVSFDGESAPDRISARAGLKELQKNSPPRRWNLVEIDADLHKLASETKHVMSLINPAKTYMDLNIGIALWLAAGGDGCLYDEVSSAGNAECHRVKYKSKARILLVGSGADEQCAGYGRHKTKFRNRSWLGLHEEMKLDMQRIWKRNLGRDDRCIADNGKEARFPFLDEDVIRILLDIPLWDIADLNQPSGVGDKKILREVARLLNLNEAAALPKRAIQFGSRIARESNKKNFGSNRAANQASAGSVVIHE